MTAPTAKIKLVYVLGFARSGTTILGNALGEVSGFTHVGELCRLWKRARFSHGKCGCGEGLLGCRFWSDSIAGAAVNSSRSSEVSLTDFVDRAWAVQRRAEKSLGLGDFLSRSRRNEALDEYAGLMEDLLRGMAKASGSRVFVDTSKLPAAAVYLKYVRNIDPYFLHLVRDPRGAVFSRQRRKAATDGSKIVLNPVTAVADCWRWSIRNVGGRIMAGYGSALHYKMLRYEDFVARPAQVLEEILDWVGEARTPLPIEKGNTVQLNQNHTVSGNLNRFETGEVVIRKDERWKTTLRSRDYLLITTLTSPMLAMYGYTLRR